MNTRPYNVIKCPHCGAYQATSAQVLKCKYCNKSRVLRSKKGHTTVIIAASFGTPRQAAQYVKEANGRRNVVMTP